MLLQQTIDIEARPEVVWKVMTDVEHWPEWTKSVDHVEKLSDEPLVVGMKVRVRQPRLPVAVWTITELDGPRYFEWQNRSFGLLSVGGHRLDPTRDGTRATLSVRWTGPLTWLAALVFKRRSIAYIEMEARGLKARCESALD